MNKPIQPFTNILVVLLIFFLTACHTTPQSYITGSIHGANLEGEKVYLVPMYGPQDFCVVIAVLTNINSVGHLLIIPPFYI